MHSTFTFLIWPQNISNLFSTERVKEIVDGSVSVSCVDYFP